MALKDGDGGLGHVTGDDGGYVRDGQPYQAVGFFSDLRLALRTRAFASPTMAKQAVVPLVFVALVLVVAVVSAAR